MSLILKSGLKFVPGRVVVTGRQKMILHSMEGDQIAKIELRPRRTKRNRLSVEAEILADLSNKGCVSSPHFLGAGSVGFSDIEEFVDPSFVSLSANDRKTTFDFFVQSYLPTLLIKRKNLDLVGILFAIAEQRKLGWFHADIKPQNLRVDPKSRLCSLIDYDQAIPLDEEKKNMPFGEFIRWADDWTHEQYKRPKATGLFGFFPNWSYENHVAPLIEEGALNISSAELLRGQETNTNKDKIYHTVRLPDVFTSGERDLSERKLVLDKIEFAAGETVLDVGSNLGLLSHYLAARGCFVTGIELDCNAVFASRMLTNIAGQSIRYFQVDIDRTELLGCYDTVMLFSVLHHTQHVARNAAKIAASTNRVIIECRRNERGVKPLDGKNWSRTSSWKHADIDTLVNSMTELFPGFAVYETYGPVDRQRYVIELRKQINS